MGVLTSSPLTVCMVTSKVYSTSLSKHTVLNTSTLVIQVLLSSKCSSTLENSRQQVHSIARGMATHFAQEHHDVLPRYSVKLAWLSLSSLSISSLLLHRPSWLGVIRYNNVTIMCRTTLCHSFSNEY